ncbi:hypothetical protein OCEANICA350_12805 [Oceanicaulis sp. 350]|nr:hypothetical protein OCEANICA350_12805 [Oceanicaulis sp. 350]
MSHTNRGRQDANKGYAQPNTQGMSQAQAQQAQKAFNDQKAKNDANKK